MAKTDIVTSEKPLVELKPTGKKTESNGKTYDIWDVKVVESKDVVEARELVHKADVALNKELTNKMKSVAKNNEFETGTDGFIVNGHFVGDMKNKPKQVDFFITANNGGVEEYNPNVLEHNVYTFTNMWDHADAMSELPQLNLKKK